MSTFIFKSLLISAFSFQVLADLATTITNDGQGKSIYIPTAGSTSSVAAPAATPTLIYNCFQMPLICENVAAWAKQINPAGNGDFQGNQLFYFDPDNTNKDSRRGQACGCFSHDDCVGSGTSNGKRSGDKVTDIATSASSFSSISQTASAIILAGKNPPQNQPRVSLPSIPGRFFADGVGLTCDEFPAATFIEGGSGAQKICALQSWQVYQGSSANSLNVGKWPLPARSGNRQEQDFQASVHVALRALLGIGSTKKKTGWGTVYPFSFSTTTSAASDSKAWVIGSPQTTKVISKRGLATQTITTTAPVITINVSGDDEVDNANPWLGHNHHAHALNVPHAADAVPTAHPGSKVRELGVKVARNPLLPRAPQCVDDFDIQGIEDTEVGDPKFDDDLPQDTSSPKCESFGVPVADVQAINDQLDQSGDDGYSFDNCCGGGDDGLCQIMGTSGLAQVSLCGEPAQCIGCARLANYVEGLINTCQSDGNVGGSQDINEAPGLKVEIQINDH